MDDAALDHEEPEDCALEIEDTALEIEDPILEAAELTLEIRLIAAEDAADEIATDEALAA